MDVHHFSNITNLKKKRKERKAHGDNMCVCVVLGLNFSQMAKKKSK